MGFRSLHPASIASIAFPARRGTNTAKPAAPNFPVLGSPILGSQILGSPVPDLRSAASGMTTERMVVVPALQNASGLCALLCLARKAAGTAAAQDLPPLSSPRKRGPRTFHKLQTVPGRSAPNSPVLGSPILCSPVPDLRCAASGMTAARTVVVSALRNASGLCALLSLARKAAGTAVAQDLPPLSSPRKRGPRTFHKLQTVPGRSTLNSPVPGSPTPGSQIPGSQILGSPIPDLRCAASGMTVERTVVVPALAAPCSVSPRTSIARSGAHSFPERCRQGLPVPAGQADRRLGPGFALLLCQDGTRGHGVLAHLSCKANAGKNREACR